MTVALSIAFDMTFPNRNPAGSGVYANELFQQLLDRDDVAVTAVTAPAGGGFPRTMRWLTDGASRAVAGTPAQLVHCPSYVAPWRLRTPFVLTIHDTSTEKFPEDHPLEWRAYAHLILPERARAAACVITGTEYTRREIIRDLGVMPARIAVTPYGVAERFARPIGAPVPAADPPVMLFPGAPTKRKNLGLVLKAMAEAPAGSVLERARLEISGATAERFPRNLALINTLGLARRVVWLGQVRSEAMPDLLASADLVVYPSLYEGFGFPALEAMMAGTPVVASTAGCLPEVLGDGALLVDPSDVRAFAAAAEAALTREDVRRSLIARGRARVARFSWPRCAELTIEVYRDVLTKAANHRAALGNATPPG